MPFGRSFLELRLPKNNLQVVHNIQEPPKLENVHQSIKMALKNPIQSLPVSSLVGPKDRIAIIIDDITRPTPSELIVPELINELKVPLDNIIIIIATGLHQANTDEEIIDLLGSNLPPQIKVINHNAFQRENLTFIGKTSRGTPVTVNNAVLAADKVITIGHIEPHEFAGYTGGRKSVFPGVAGAEGINHNHSLKHIDHPNAKIGVLQNNPIHEDLVEAADLIGVNFLINVVLNSNQQITRVVAGNLHAAYQHGIDYYQNFAQVDNSKPVDIVLTSTGYPLDLNFYQAVKAIFAAESFVKDNGYIIHLAECLGGFGTSLFYDWMTSFSAPSDIFERIKQEGYRADIDHCYMLARILNKCKVIVVSLHPQVHELKESLIKTTISPVEALNMALKNIRGDATIAALPYAQRIIPKH